MCLTPILFCQVHCSKPKYSFKQFTKLLYTAFAEVKSLSSVFDIPVTALQNYSNHCTYRWQHADILFKFRKGTICPVFELWGWNALYSKATKRSFGEKDVNCVWEERTWTRFHLLGKFYCTPRKQSRLQNCLGQPLNLLSRWFTSTSSAATTYQAVLPEHDSQH